MPRCSSCNKEKPVEEFNKNKGRKNKLNGFCKTCMKKYRNKNIEEYKKYNIKYKKDNAEDIKERRKKYERLDHVKKLKKAGKLKYRYGITMQRYKEMLISQDNKCKICGKPYTDTKPLSVDHDHITNKVRGLLCGNCNRGIGIFKDNINNLINAINYLQIYGK